MLKAQMPTPPGVISSVGRPVSPRHQQDENLMSTDRRDIHLRCKLMSDEHHLPTLYPSSVCIVFSLFSINQSIPNLHRPCNSFIYKLKISPTGDIKIALLRVLGALSPPICCSVVAQCKLKLASALTAERASVQSLSSLMSSGYH